MQYLEEAQLVCLCSPIRVRIVVNLRSLGPLPIRSIAREMGRAPDSLYHHFRLLLKTNLIRVVGTQISGKREEAIYDVVAANTLAMPSPWPDSYRSATKKFVRAVAEDFVEDFGKAVDQHAAQPSLHDITTARRQIVRLTQSKATELRRKVNAIEQWIAANDDPHGTVTIMSFLGLVSETVEK